MIPVTITVTPVGVPAGLLCITGKSASSFSVELLEIPGLKAGTRDISFDWIAIGRRAGFESRPEIPEELAAINFDANMKEFAFSEADTDDEARPMWFDGVSLRWETPPRIPMSQEESRELEEVRLEHERHEAEHQRMLDEHQRLLAEQDQ